MERQQNKKTLLKKALESLKKAINEDDGTDYLQDAIIQRFEYTFELSWKYLQSVLQEQGAEVYGPKDIIKKASRFNLIEDTEVWLDLLEARNLASHSYNEEIAKEVAKIARKLPELIEQLISKEY